ncbi:MAG: MATE family efflux transporter [Bacteroidales bacterium]|nr:MATE family efflux transporter [Bacteroidales bacterium]
MLSLQRKIEIIKNQEMRISIKNDLKKLFVPIFIETLLVMLLGVMDTFMLSQYSDESVAAVGMDNQILQILLLLFTIINAGTSVLCSQYLGAGIQHRLKQVVGVALLLNFCIGTVMGLLMLVYAENILIFMGLRQDLMPHGIIYMQIVGGFSVLQALQTTTSAVLRSVNKAIYPMIVVGIVNVLNIFGNYTLIFGKFGMPALGVEGAAISTAVSRAVAMIILFVLLFRTTIHKLPLSLFRPFPIRELKNLLHIGLPSAGENISYQMQQLVILYFINFISTDALTTRTYVCNIVMFVYLFAICMANSGSILIGQMMGKAKVQAAYLIGKYVWHISLMVSFVLSVLCALSGKYVIGLLTNNPEVIALGCTVLWIDVFLEPGKCINIYATNALRATGDVYFPFILGLIVQWCVGVLLGYIFGIALGWGLAGMWLAFLLDEDIRGIVFVKRWNSLKWARHKFV